jgi:predicted TIM-barrel fold metal-dependent hydrolase
VQRTNEFIGSVDALAGAGITVITHVGAGGDTDANDRGSPRSLRVLLDAVPGLRVIACHFGGYHRLDEAEELLVGYRAVLETSWPPSTAGLDPARIREIIARHGAGRVVYGSDWPMTDPATEIAAIRALGLPPDDETAILGGNLAALLGIS